jgi:hypothetical protein
MQQYAFEPSDSIMLLNLAFGWPKRRQGIWLYGGVNEMDLAAAIDVNEATSQLFTVSDAPSVRSHHGLQLAPRRRSQSLPDMHRLLIPGGDGAKQASPDFAFHAALEDLAREYDTATATFAAKRLEVRAPIKLIGQRWPLRPFLMLMLAGTIGMLILRAFLGCSQLLRGQSRTELFFRSRFADQCKSL